MTVSEKLEWNVCSNCPLKGSKRVRGRGNIDAGIWFVGEAPGREEEKEGRPFVGPSGKILQEGIDSLGLKENEYYVTNLIQCRPSDSAGRNRPPTVDEKHCCGIYLEDLMMTHHPRIVVLVGNHAVRHFMSNKVSTSVDTGNWVHNVIYNTIFFVMLHPAATLYNPSTRPLWIKSFSNLKDAIADAVCIRLTERGEDD